MSPKPTQCEIERTVRAARKAGLPTTVLECHPDSEGGLCFHKVNRRSERYQVRKGARRRRNNNDAIAYGYCGDRLSNEGGGS
jgi:hypothetical protein